MIYHKSILADLLTPAAAFMRVSRGSERAFLLESVEGGEKMGRYSFIGVDPDQSFEGKYAEFCSNFPEERPSDPDLPPFTGGAVGAFCYEMVREFERLPDLKEEVAKAASAAGRDISQITVAPQILCCVADNPEELAQAEKEARSHMSYYIGGMGQYYYNLFCRFGYLAESDAVRQAWSEGDRGRAAA
ncbi:MAG: LLM class flavin-dependent oxidoreductase, partial [Acidobacteria bacterium]|nr:LLM class flavin-dependent oxidoreductase [Acidobacteriota bacterium]